MRTWIFCVNQCGASVYMKGDRAREEPDAIVELLYPRLVSGEQGELGNSFLRFISAELKRICGECQEGEQIFVCAQPTLLKQILLAIQDAKIEDKISGTIEQDLRSTPIEYISKYATEMLGLRTG